MEETFFSHGSSFITKMSFWVLIIVVLGDGPLLMEGGSNDGPSMIEGSGWSDDEFDPLVRRSE